MNRGELYRLKSARGQGHEQQGIRYAVVVQANELMPLSTVLVAPTSTAAMQASFRPEVTVNGQRTKVLVEQIGAANLSRLGKCVGRLDWDELEEVNRAVTLVFGLS